MNAMEAVDQASSELVRRGLRMSTVFGARRHERFPDGLPWTCTLRYGRRRMTIAYFTHPGLQEEPTAADVVASLLEDAGCFWHVRDFVEFCAAFGYERDGRTSEWAYAACGDAAAGLRRLLQDDEAMIAAALDDLRLRAHRSNGQQLAASPTTWSPEAETSTLLFGQGRT